MEKPNELHSALTVRLRNAFTKEQIQHLAGSLAEFRGVGLKLEDIFPQGIPVPDVLVLKTSVPLTELGAAMMHLQKFPELRRIEVFPRGIPSLDSWRVNVGLGMK